MVIESATLDLGAKSGEAIATYDYQDIEDGSGYVNYNLYAIEDTSGFTYRISKSAPLSSRIVFSETAVGTHTWDFYTGTFATPKVLEGTALFNFGFGVDKSGVSEVTMIVHILLYHYDGSTSTQIGSTWISPTLVCSGGTGDKYSVGGAEISCPRKKFRKGDQIRIEIKMILTDAAPVLIDRAEIGIDPKNRDGNYITPSSNTSHTTQFIASLPFRLKN